MDQYEFHPIDNLTCMPSGRNVEAVAGREESAKTVPHCLLLLSFQWNTRAREMYWKTRPDEKNQRRPFPIAALPATTYFRFDGTRELEIYWKTRKVSGLLLTIQSTPVQILRQSIGTYPISSIATVHLIQFRKESSS